MEEIKVGEYVRTVKGEIGKYTIIEGLYCIETAGGYFNNIGITIEDIKSHSKNLIDLIEIGDYVNGKLIIGKEFTSGYPQYEKNIDDYCVISQFYENDIKSIVTKEAFASREYKVGGENE